MASTLHVDSILDTMLSAAKNSIAKDWANVADEATHQLQFMAKSVAILTDLVAQGKLTQEQAKLDFAIAKNTAEINLITHAGLSKLMVQHAFHEALEAIKDVVERAIGFDLL